MTELSTDLAPTEPLERSTQLDEGRPAEASPTKPVEEKPKTESRLDAIKRAADDVEKAHPKVSEKVQAEAKPAEAAKPDDGKAEADKPVEETKPDAETKPVQQERGRRQPIEPPANFMPRAKELWPNTPHEVRSDMQRVINEAQAETAQARETVREYEAVKPYADMARQSGTTIDVALGKYVQMEQALRSDPATGFRSLLSNMQITPVQAVGHIMSAYGIRPEQLAQHMAQSPNEYTALAPAQRQQPQPQQNGETEALKQQIDQLRQTMATSHVETTIIAPFAAENPRYHELEDTIARFLQSDIVPKSLSPHDRLAAAYDMAVRISPSVRQAPASLAQEGDGEKADSRAGEDFGGNKSVRGAPASGVDTSNRRRGKMSRGDALSAAFTELGLAN